MPLRLSAFPKCYIEQIAGDRSMSVFQWIEMAKALDADGLEMLDGFLQQGLHEATDDAALWPSLCQAVGMPGAAS